jgi:hypothetical protein
VPHEKYSTKPTSKINPGTINLKMGLEYEKAYTKNGSASEAAALITL